ncbi:MAG TPA: lanthionine synthetase LanC family protein [Candidatus Saccharimonadales bacterium]|nr:lanthionine synthetase LanC family protein [Candidatus Saccharimonadales bacterium]
MKNNYLQEAITIGEQLLKSAEKDSHGIFWKTATLDSKNSSFNWEASESLYSGTSGITLFFIELFRHTKEKKYLEIVKKAMDWVDWYCEKNPTTHYAFVSGRLGVSYTYLKLYELTKKKIYLTKALSLAKGSLAFIESPYTIHEFINGSSGALLVLLHLYDATHEEWLLKYIEKYEEQLLKKATYAKNGLFWDTSAHAIHPLCGFSHGTSGIGFVFLELGHYFKNPAYFYIAEQAFAYENQYFNKDKNNWPDYRIAMYDQTTIQEAKTKFKQGNLDMFLQEKNMNAWCHGAAGIGLSRIRANQLLKNSPYSTDVKNSNKKTQHTHTGSFTLCHGDGGNADIFIEKFIAFNNKEDLVLAQKVADSAIEQKKRTGMYPSGLGINIEDLSLFNGIAGIGYFFLRVTDPMATTSILAPKINSTDKKTIVHQYSLPDLKKLLMSNIFPRTIEHLEKFATRKFTAYFRSTSQKKEPTAFIEFVSDLIQTLPKEQSDILSNYFHLERRKLELRLETKSNGLLFIQEVIQFSNSEQYSQLPNDKLLKKKFLLSPEVTFFISAHPLETIFLLRVMSTGVEELEVSQFCYLVLNEFTKTQTTSTVIETILTLYEAKNTNKEELVREKIIQQIREAIAYAILIPS